MVFDGLFDLLEDSLKDAFKQAQKHAPALLAGTGVSLLIGSGIAAVAATPKACRDIQEAQYENGGQPLTVKEKVQVAWKGYALPIAGAVAGTTCVILSVRESNKRYVALSTAYKLTDETFRIYKEKVNERLNAKQRRELEGEVEQERLNRHPITQQDTELLGNYGGKRVLCYESITGRYLVIENYKEAIHRVENNVNYMILNENYASLNYVCSELGLEPVDLGYDLGWNIDNVPTQGGFKIETTPKFASNGDPCVCLSYNIMPQSKYDIFA